MFAPLRLRVRPRELQASDTFPTIRGISAGHDPPASAAASLRTRECCMDRESRAMANRGRSVDTTRAAGAETTYARSAAAESRAVSLGACGGWLPFRRAIRSSIACASGAIRRNNEDVKIYTRTGDDGDTGLFDGTRVSKDDPRVAAYGDVDELNAWVGLVRAAIDNDQGMVEMLDHIQRDLFGLGARLADPARKIAERVSKAAVTPHDIGRLEQWIDLLESELPPLRRFILAGGSTAGAALHVARTVCRRAERSIVALGPEAVEPEVLVYINRLSDLLFVMARAINRRSGAPEQEW